MIGQNSIREKKINRKKIYDDNSCLVNDNNSKCKGQKEGIGQHTQLVFFFFTYTHPFLQDGMMMEDTTVVHSNWIAETLVTYELWYEVWM